jgi:ribonucleotide reductase alpha subunit
MEHMGITIDPNRDTLFDELGTTRLRESYMMDQEISPQERFAYVSKTFSSNPEHAQRLYDYSSKHWLSYSTPILSYGRSKRGLPISCYLNFINDTAEGLVDNLSETNWLSMMGGGVGIGFGIRSADDKSTGVMPHLKMYDASSLAYRQGRTRRGSYAAYLDISNLCVEVILPTNKDRTAVCCLSSLNLEYYDEWSKEPMFLKDVLEMLDNVLQKFIDDAPDSISRARFSAIQERSVGVGALGFHAYLQKKGLPWESALSKSTNIRMFKHIRTGLDEANKQLGSERGEAPDAVGTGLRCSHVMAIAPNASSSILMGNTSPSIEPWRANAYRQDTLSGSFLNKNKYLDMLIKKKCQEDSSVDYDKVWSTIIANDGSVQTVKCLDDYEKDIYKTAMEIDQRWVIEHAADRQEFIDQAQSLNVFFRPDANISYLHAVHFLAWKKQLKTMYYCRSEKISKADKVSKRIERDIIKELDMTSIAAGEDTCLACEG